MTLAQSNKLRRLIEAYGQAKSGTDWQNDQGFGPAVARAAKAYEAARAKLEKYIVSLTEKV